MNSALARQRTIRNLTIFSIVTLTSGWLGYTFGEPPDSPLQRQGLAVFFWLVMPLFTALLLRAFVGDGWDDFWLRPHLKKNLGWYLAGIFVYPILALLMLALGGLFGLVTAPNFSWSLVLSAFVSGFWVSLMKDIFEEFAWRGYLAPKVYSLGLNAYLGHLIVGFIWGCWHIPFVYYIMDRRILQATTEQSVASFTFMLIINLMAASIVYGEILLMARSVWPAVLMHTVSNSFVGVLVTRGFFQITPGADYLVSPWHQSVLALVVFTLMGIGLHRIRVRRETT